MNVAKSGDTGWTDLGGGVRRQVLAHDESIMVVRVAFEAGAIGAQHSHPHAQSTYVLSGEFVFTGGGRDAAVAAGDSLAFAKNETHGCVCRAAGELIDVFSPQRDDFLSFIPAR